MRQEDIAQALGITVPTLRKHYADELTAGAAQERMAVLEKVLAAAKKGSTSAARLYLQQQDRTVEAGAGASGKQGKKELAKAEALTAERGTDWDSLIGEGASNVTPLRRAG